jgi:CheY-like chemotaxis protein/anti-sigma regulatory factor (Ser/Thr protein kinase)
MGDGLLGALSTQQHRAVHIMHENGAHLLDLINDILDMSRVASGQMELHWDQVPVNQLCDAGLRLIGPAARRKELTVSTTFDPRVCLVRGDSRRLKQMLVNLLGNAVKFTPQGGAIGLDVTANAGLREMRIGIWDTGVGIPADQFERLFQPFVQLDSTPARQHDGTGLGLALASGMAELHQGRIEVQSEVGRGSRFEIVLPWDPQAQTADQLRQEPVPIGDADEQAEPLQQPRVLLVEDNESNLEMLSTYLRIKGCEVFATRTGISAIALARKQRPDLILMDVQMPEMDGLETTRRLRTDPALRRTPIIALTALAMPGDREHCLYAGMDDYLSKPVGLKELHGTVIHWISRTRAA